MRRLHARHHDGGSLDHVLVQVLNNGLGQLGYVGQLVVLHAAQVLARGLDGCAQLVIPVLVRGRGGSDWASEPRAVSVGAGVAVVFFFFFL